jgi:predicted P-loop ATPase
MDDKGNYRRTLDNMILIMENDPNLKGRFAKNAFTDRDTVTGDLPWRKVLHDTSYFTDIDLIGLCHYLESTYGIDHKGKIKDAAEAVLYRHRHHPVREYLEALEWDGQKRLDTVLIDYLGAQDNTYTRTVTRKTLVAAVARIMEPGVKFDYVLTLVGRQGSFKSTLIRKLGMQWYCENLTTVQGKEAAEQIRGVWLQEMGELAGLRKAEVEVIKNYISRTEDSYRPAYGVKKETYARQCIFIGTTNNDDFLRDPTGNRRFWPVPVDRDLAIYHVPSELTQEEVNQIWAEALQAYRAGETLHLEEEIEELAREMQERHTERDSRFEVVQQYLETPVPEDWAERDLSERRMFLSGGELQAEGRTKRSAISVAEIWCEALGRMIGDMTTNNTKPIHDIMKRMPGWRMSDRKMRSKVYGCQRVYRKTDN